MVKDDTVIYRIHDKHSILRSLKRYFSYLKKSIRVYSKEALYFWAQTSREEFVIENYFFLFHNQNICCGHSKETRLNETALLRF